MTGGKWKTLIAVEKSHVKHQIVSKYPVFRMFLQLILNGGGGKDLLSTLYVSNTLQRNKIDRVTSQTSKYSSIPNQRIALILVYYFDY